MIQSRTIPVERHARLRPACERDAHLRHTAEVLKRCSPDGPVVLAAAVELQCHSQPSRWMGGLAPSPASEAIKFVRQLSKHPATSPFPLISELRLVALAHGLKERSTQWLIARWHELVERECSAEAAENLASLRRSHDREGWRAALKAEADLQLELHAVDAELQERDVDPDQYIGDGKTRIIR